MIGVRATRTLGGRRIGLVAGCTWAASAAASGAPGAEGVALALVLLPVAIYLIAVAVLLLFGVFHRRRWVIANTIGSVLATALVIATLSQFELPPGSGSTIVVLGTLAVMSFVALAPRLQYVAARKQWHAVSITIRAVVAMGLAAPLAAWLVYQWEGAKYQHARLDSTARGQTARAGDLAAVVREYAGDRLHTIEFSDFLHGLHHSRLLLDAAPLNDDDRAAAERLITDRTAYFGPLHAKLVWDRHAGHSTDALLSDPDASLVRYHLLEILERHAGTRYCGSAEDIRALRSGVHGWFASEARNATDDDARRNATIEALCAVVEAR